MSLPNLSIKEIETGPDNEITRDHELQEGEISFADETMDNISSEVVNREQVFQTEITYKFTIRLDPEIRNYFYSPGPDGYYKGQAVLDGSPTFDGPSTSKWQITWTLNHWIGMQRWMSLNLTRADDRDNSESIFDLLVQCEFKILDKQGRAVYSARNKMCNPRFPSGETCGFSKFIPFANLANLLIDGNLLSIQADLCILFLRSEIENTAQNVRKDVQEPMEENILYLNTPNTDIPEDDRVEIQLTGELVTYANRDKLKEKSRCFTTCIENKWDCSTINLLPFSEQSLMKQKRAIHEYVKYVHGTYCPTLSCGSYTDVQVLMELAAKFESEDLIKDCITVMTLNVTPSTAADNVLHLKNYSNLIDEDILASFRRFFKDNFHLIRKTDRFQKLKQNHVRDFMAFLFSSK